MNKCKCKAVDTCSPSAHLLKAQTKMSFAAFSSQCSIAMQESTGRSPTTCYKFKMFTQSLAFKGAMCSFVRGSFVPYTFFV